MSVTAGLVDFHCHLDLYPDHETAVREADEAGVFTLAVTTTPRAWPRNHELAQRTKHVRAALGLHPQLVAEREAEIALWDDYLSETRYVGEVGLDAGPRYYKSMEAQQRVFQHVLRRCAGAGDKIITVHSVRAVRAVLEHVEAFLPRNRGKVVMHWFTGTKSEARRAMELGCYFSINAAMLASERHLTMVQAIPLDRLLTETDGPFTRTEDRPSKPSDVASVVEELGRLHRLPAAQVAKIVRDNLRNLVS
ncbi:MULTISPECIES: Qat anti-phage system TatD family nuclease QatD [Burkholderiales]|uniref:Qat anti-phage system TatD family nuclease QatD n=1 Tax=Burkholderiales TaxID=80840 RepID=UPI000A324E0A|nr:MULTISPECIES: Qat anti-phage system TatD family nuclease QatD [Burkholderiales]KAA1287394.1 TatD family deoxyribonuclease [Alcaligenes faecalis]KAB0597352.1 TatD family deoxyribonuclease [Cupriavidus pauculus]UAL00900.1 TatD family hydrolase [Cupriavidus pauculus]